MQQLLKKICLDGVEDTHNHIKILVLIIFHRLGPMV